MDKVVQKKTKKKEKERKWEMYKRRNAEFFQKTSKILIEYYDICSGSSYSYFM
jgi:hypothetical protein